MQFFLWGQGNIQFLGCVLPTLCGPANTTTLKLNIPFPVILYQIGSSSFHFHSFLLGAPLCVHPGRDETAPSQILDILEAAGADISHTVIAHLDRTIFSRERLLNLAQRGCYLEYDLFGIECSHFQVCLPSEVYLFLWLCNISLAEGVYGML